jgi:hypothetical protein
MDLGQAEIWNADIGFVHGMKMLLGRDVREAAARNRVETTL